MDCDWIITVGDEVGVKSVVTEPKLGWGLINHTSVGVISEIEGQEFIVNFPEQAGWRAHRCEMDKVPRSQTVLSSNVALLISHDKPPPESTESIPDEDVIQVGDEVRAKPFLMTPAQKWGSIKQSSIGKVTDIHGGTISVKFNKRCWTGMVSKIEKVPKPHLGITCHHCLEHPIVGRRYKCSVCADCSLCSGCYCNHVHETPEHIFSLIRQPGDNPLPRDSSGKSPSAPLRWEQVPLRPMKKWRDLVVKLEASSGGKNLHHLLDGKKDTAWMSADRSGNDHFLVLHLQPHAVISSLAMQVDSVDETYMPQKVNVSLFGTDAITKEWTVLVPQTCKSCWLWQNCDENVSRITICMKEQHGQGINCKIRGLRIEGYSLAPKAKTLAERKKRSLVMTKTSCEAIEVGDEVRVKLSVAVPLFNWGHVKRSSIGKVTSIAGEKLTIDFPEQKSWCGALPEMERAPVTLVVTEGRFLWFSKDRVATAMNDLMSKEDPIQIGDEVRVKPSLMISKHRWGPVVKPSSVGRVILLIDDKVVVQFDEQQQREGVVSEMEKARKHSGITCSQCKASPIIGLRYTCSICVGYDLCSGCYSTFTHANPEHRFLLIRMPVLTEASEDQPDRSSASPDFAEVVAQPFNKDWKTLLEKLEVSSGGESLLSLIDGDRGTYWMSNNHRAGENHYITLHLLPGCVVTNLSIKFISGDVSYMPSLISVAFSGHPQQTKNIDILANANLCHLIQGGKEHHDKITILIKKCHGHGINCKISGLHIEGYSRDQAKETSEIEGIPKKRLRIAPGTVSLSIRLGSIIITVKRGDITYEENDVIVNSCDWNFNLSTGISSAIASKGGDSIKNELSQQSNSTFRETGGGNLPCKKIYHVAFPDDLEMMPASIGIILATAEARGVRSISFPAIGTGGKGKTASSMASAMLQGFQQFTSRGRQILNLKEVNIVVWTYQMALEFIRILREVEETLPPITELEQAVRCFNQAGGEEMKSSSDYEEKSVEDESIANLTDWELNEIAEIACRNGVGILVDRIQKKVHIRGLRNSIWGSCMSIKNVFHRLTVAKTLRSRTKVTWKWTQWIGLSSVFSSTEFPDLVLWTEFPDRAVQILEDAYQENQKGGKEIFVEIFFENKMSKFQVDFVGMKLTGDAVINIIRNAEGDYPRDWTEMSNQLFMEVVLPSLHEEYLDVKRLFESTLPHRSIISISRIQNKQLYDRYQLQKQSAIDSCRKSDVEMKLFHGTAVADAIMKQGFDRNYAGKNATCFGKGVYFAKQASYSDDERYAKPDSNGVKTILLAYVITGNYCQGSCRMLSAPVKPGGSGTEVYDCVVDNPANPTVFVIFRDGGAYPAYAIKYRMLNSPWL